MHLKAELVTPNCLRMAKAVFEESKSDTVSLAVTHTINTSCKELNIRQMKSNRGCVMQRAELQAVHPVLPSRNVAAAIEYYVTRLGFSLEFQDAESEPRYAVLRRDNVVFHVQWHDPVEWKAVERPMLRFVVSDVQVLFDEFKDKQVFHQNTALRETDWGTREFAFFDLDQNGLTFYHDL